MCVPGSCQCVIVPPERGLVGLLPCLPTNYFVATGLPVNVFTFFMNSTLLAGQEMKDEEVAVQRWALQIGKKNWFQCIPCLLLDTWNLPYLPETPKDYFVQGGNSPSINDHCFYSLWNPRVYIYIYIYICGIMCYIILPRLIALTISYCMWIYHYPWWPLIIKWLIIHKLSGSQHSHCLTLARLAEFELIRVHLAAGCNFSLLEKQTAICLSCCPSPSLSLQYPPSN